jgi:hypothetical protein
MAKAPSFDEQAAHRHFAAACFNRAWDLIDKADRTPEEDREMVRLSHASHWHWTQVEGHTQTNLSVGYWQTSRIYSLLGEAENARRYAELCLDASRGGDVEPFYLGCAYEALARAAAVGGDAEAAGRYRREAARLAEAVSDEASREQLVRDLKTIAQVR